MTPSKRGKSGGQPLHGNEEECTPAERHADELDFGFNLSVLVDYDTLRKLRELLEIEYPELPVLSYQELTLTLNV